MKLPVTIARNKKVGERKRTVLEEGKERETFSWRREKLSLGGERNFLLEGRETFSWRGEKLSLGGEREEQGAEGKKSSLFIHCQELRTVKWWNGLNVDLTSSVKVLLLFLSLSLFRTSLNFFATESTYSEGHHSIRDEEVSERRAEKKQSDEEEKRERKRKICRKETFLFFPPPPLSLSLSSLSISLSPSLLRKYK